MTIKDIIWPWGALVKARRTIIDLRQHLDDISNVLHHEQDCRQTDRKEYDLGRRLLRAEIERLERLLKNGHFRNPKTGRLGRKGERF